METKYVYLCRRKQEIASIIGSGINGNSRPWECVWGESGTRESLLLLEVELMETL